eukprot:4638572-Pleurochrysis_carterae.AAC.1
MPIHTGIPHAAADGDAHDDDGAAAAAAAAAAVAPATPATPSTGRHAATYEIECIRLRQKFDAQRNTIVNLEAEIEAAAQKEGAAVAAEEARTAYEINVKQQQAAANEERDASSNKVTDLEANITELQRTTHRANAAARLLTLRRMPRPSLSSRHRCSDFMRAASGPAFGRSRRCEAHAGRGGAPCLAGAGITEPGQDYCHRDGFTLAVDFDIAEAITSARVSCNQVPGLFLIFARFFRIKLPTHRRKVPHKVVDGYNDAVEGNAILKRSLASGRPRWRLVAPRGRCRAACEACV